MAEVILNLDNAEIARLEDALLRFAPARQWEIKTVTFPATAGQDLEITHTLSPTNPEHVDWMVLQAPGPLLVYKDTSAARTAWSTGVVRLRCTAASAQVVIALSVAADEENRVDPAGEMPNFSHLNAGFGVEIGENVAPSGSAATVGIRFHPVGDTTGASDWALGVTGGTGVMSGANQTVQFFSYADGTAGIPALEYGYDSGDSTFLLQPGDSQGLQIGHDSSGHRLKDVISARFTETGYTAGVGRWTDYSGTITWASLSGAQPSLGNGTLKARYTKMGKTVLWTMKLTPGTTTTFGGGIWVFTLPTTAADQDLIRGQGVMHDEGTMNYFAGILATSTTAFIVIGDNNTAGSGGVTATTPFTWSAGGGDALSLSGFYEEA